MLLCHSSPNVSNMDKYFDEFKRLSLSILAQSDNCQESQDLFRAAQSVPEMATAWQRYWAGVLHEVPEQVIKAFSAFYPTYRDDVIRAGICYNEAPPADAPASIVLIGDPASDATTPEGSPSGSPLVIGNRHRVYILGSLPVICTDNANVHIVSDRANVTLRGSARCNIEAGHVEVHDHAIVTGRGHVTCYDSATVFLYGGSVTSHGHMAITAYNDAAVHSFTNRRITLNDNSTLYYE